jgi:hypothetical protein
MHSKAYAAGAIVGTVALTIATEGASEGEVEEAPAAAESEPPGGGDPAAGLRRQLEAHQEKLEQYKADPDAFDNKDFLKNAPDEEARQRIIEGRIRKLQGQIENFRKQIRDLEGGGGS